MTTPPELDASPDYSIRFIEELSLTALPALQTAYYDGWVLRFARGFTRRANSVNPIYLSTADVDEKIRQCEQLYIAHKLPTVFKMTPTCYPVDLDRQLAFHNYKEEGGASVQVCDLTALETSSAVELAVSSHLTDEWLDAYFRLNLTPERHLKVMGQILNAILPQKCCAALYRDKAIVAVGLGVLDQGYLGLFDIVTQAEVRRQGLGRQLVMGLLDWGKTNGATRAYLQVVPTNTPALNLYEALGFREAYQYWYRTKIL